ncbi:hypothetical protein BDR06DRAFT_1024265, partial [Suillus hirtellus]
MTSPTRRNRCWAAQVIQDRPLPDVPQPNFVPANEPQAGPVLRPFAWQPPAHFPYQPLPVERYPGLPRNAIVHVEHAHHHIPPVDYNARLNEQMNAAQNDRRHQRNLHWRQDREEIRQQAQAELMAAGIQPPQITPERDHQSQREQDRINRLQMTSPTRRNRCWAAQVIQDRPLPDVPQPNFVPANEPQAGPVLRPFAWQPPAHFPYQPLPVERYPGLPRNAIAHVEHAHHHIPPVDYNARLNEQMNAAQNDRRHQRNLHWRQDREEIRQQAQAELMAAGIQPPQVPHIPDEPAPVPPAPAYGPIHYEGAVGPQNFNDPLHYFAHNPAPPLHAPPQPDYHQFNIQFHHHFQQEEMENERIRNDFLQRQAQEAFHQQQIQLELQQQEARWRNREAQYAFEIQQQEVEWHNRQAQEAHRIQQEEAERADRQAQDIQQAGQQVEEERHRQEQRNHEQQERLEEALREYDNPASQQQHEDDEERRRTQEQERRQQRDAEDDEYINQAPVRNISIPDGARPYTEPIDRHTLGPLNVECPNCHALHFACERLTKSSAQKPHFGTCCLEGKVDLPPFPAWPLELQQAYRDRDFVSKIRQYNSALAFTS